MLINRNKTIAAIVGAAALVAGSLASVSPASADWHGHGGWGRGGWVGPAIGLGAGVAIGSALAAPYYGYGPYYGYDYGPGPYAYGPPRYAYNDADAYCAARFRTYDPASRTYMGYDGFRHRCP